MEREPNQERITEINLRMGELAVERATLDKEWDELLAEKLMYYSKELSQ